MDDSSKLSPHEPVVVAPRLTAVREALELTKTDFAARIGVDKSSWTKIEKGEKPLLPKDAFRIYELYGVDLNFIYLGQIGGLPASLSTKIITHLKGAKQ